MAQQHRMSSLEVLTFRSFPIPLSNKKPTPHSLRVCLSRLINQKLLSLNDRARLALIIDSDDFTADREFLPCAGRWEWLEECDLALSIDYTSRIELGYTWDWGGFLAGVEVGDFIVREFEGYGREMSGPNSSHRGIQGDSYEE